MSGCEKLSYNTVRHNAEAAVLRKLFKKVGWETRLKEQAGWVVGAPGLRPYNVPARLPPGLVLMLQWLIHLGMATSELASATSRRRRQQQGMSMRSRLSITGCPLSTVSVTWSTIPRWASRLLAASERRRAPYSMIYSNLRRQLRPHYPLLSGHGQQWEYQLTSSGLFRLRL